MRAPSMTARAVAAAWGMAKISRTRRSSSPSSPAVLTHGDFAPASTLTAGTAVTGLPDFEAARLADPAATDAQMNHFCTLLTQLPVTQHQRACRRKDTQCSPGRQLEPGLSGTRSALCPPRRGPDRKRSIAAVRKFARREPGNRRSDQRESRRSKDREPSQVWRSLRVQGTHQDEEAPRSLGRPGMAMEALGEHLQRQAAARQRAGVLWQTTGSSSRQRSGRRSISRTSRSGITQAGVKARPASPSSPQEGPACAASRDRDGRAWVRLAASGVGNTLIGAMPGDPRETTMTVNDRCERKVVIRHGRGLWLSSGSDRRRHNWRRRTARSPGEGHELAVKDVRAQPRGAELAASCGGPGRHAGAAGRLLGDRSAGGLIRRVKRAVSGHLGHPARPRCHTRTHPRRRERRRPSGRARSPGRWPAARR